MAFFVYYTRYGRDAALAALNGQSYDYAFRRMVYDLKNTLELDSSQEIWLIENKEEAEAINDFLAINETSSEAMEYARWMLQTLSTGTELQKDLIQAVLDNNTQQATAILLQGATFDTVQCCDDDQTPAVMAAITAKIAVDFLDSGFNMFIGLLEIFRSDEREGYFVREVMLETGIPIPDEINDETLGALFKVRKRDRELVVEPYGEWYTPILDVGFTALDFMAVISPSTNGGAFLVAKGGGTVTAKVLSDYLKVLAKGSWKTVNESMSDNSRLYQEFVTGKSITEGFEMILPDGKTVWFDGIRDGVLAEAKADYSSFIEPSTGRFKTFFLNTGAPSLLSQARRQLEAAEGLPVIWYFQFEDQIHAFKTYFENNGITNIIYKFLPMSQ